MDKAAAFENAPSMRQLGYPAHLTFATYDEIEPDLVSAALASLDGEAPFALSFTEIRWFDGDQVVLWLKPALEPWLHALHRRIHNVVGETRCSPHYRSAAWRPHCTLAVSVPRSRRAEAIAFARAGIAPLTLRFDRAEAVRWPPPVPVQSIVLGVPDRPGDLSGHRAPST